MMGVEDESPSGDAFYSPTLGPADRRDVQLLPAGASPPAQRKCWVVALAAVLGCLVLAAVVAGVVLADADTRQKLLNYGSIPLVAAIVGWGTNVVALQMTFYPLEFHGCLPNARIFDMPLFGWQGIIPSKCSKMAGQAVDLMTTRLLDVREIFSRLDPTRVAAELRAPLEAMTPKMLETLAKERIPAIWQNLSETTKSEIATKCLDDSPRAIADMMSEIREDITQVFDLREMVVSMFEADKQLTNDIFLKCGEDEFRFIRHSGFYLGFFFGLVQMGIWVLCDKWWILPVAGFVVGYLTNFVALKIIFQPIHPKKLCCCTVQGLFLKRQKEVAVVYADLISQKVLTADNLLVAMIRGPCSDKLFEVLDRHIQRGVDTVVSNSTGVMRPLAMLVVGSEEYRRMKVRVSDILRGDVERFMPHLSGYVDEALNIRQTLEESMCQLSSEDFEGLLHPVFQEDEIKLIMVGGFLGVLVGLAQAWAQVDGTHCFNF